MTGNRHAQLSASVATDAPFSSQEYRERLDRIRTAMERDGVDLLYLSAPESICYVSGYEAQWYQGQATSDWSPGSGIAVRADQDHYLHFEDEDEWVLARATSGAKDLRIRSHDGEIRTWLDFVVSELESAGWLRGTAGLEMWSSRPHRGYSELFQAALEAKGAQVVDATKIVRRVRAIKSAGEIACLRTAQQVADVGMRAVIDHLRPGMTELDVYAEIVFAVAKAGGETPGVPAMVAAGEGSASIHSLPSRRVIRPGDIVDVDIFGVHNRYHASLARCFSMGEPSPAVSAQIDRVAGGAELAAQIIRPGLPIMELLGRMEAYYRDVGIWDDQWWIGGYELGIAFPPDTVGEFYYEVGLDPGEDVFEPGMVCNYESNFYLPEAAGVAVQTNTMAFTEQTAEFLSTTRAQLVVID